MRTSLFTGFNSAVRAMQQAQFALTVHGSNIANANDPTYTRRDVLPPSDTALTGPGVARIRDSFVEDQFRRAQGALGEGEVRASIMSKVEDIFGDPVDGGLRFAIDNFYDAWQGLAEFPSDGVARLQVMTAGQSFAQQIREAYAKLSSVEQTTNEELAVRVGEVNTLLEKVHDLNRKVSELARNRMDDSALRDQRDKALDELAKLTGASATFQPDGTVRVIVGSTVVMDGGPTLVKLGLSNGPDGPVPTWQGYPDPHYGGTGIIAGLVGVRDGELKQLKSDIDNLGRTVATKVNEQHAKGFGLDGVNGRPFFAISAAPADIEVDRNLTPEQVAAGSPTGSGEISDGGNARLITQLGETGQLSSVIIPDQLQSPRVYYRNLVGWVGARAQAAQLSEDVAQTHTRVTMQQRQSQWGVSLDEETAMLTMQQQAFAAAARVITVMDDMLDTLINRTGR